VSDFWLSNKNKVAMVDNNLGEKMQSKVMAAALL